MKRENQSAHRVVLDLLRPVPERFQVDLGARFKVRVSVETDSGCDLTGAPYELRAESGDVVATGTFPTIHAITPDSFEYDPRHGEVDTRPHVRLSIVAPRTIGEFRWKIVLLPTTVGGVDHESAELEFSLETSVHRLSLAAWDVTSPVEIAGRLRLKAGIKCSAGCKLAGELMEVVDAEGNAVGGAATGEAPLSRTEALYWTEFDLAAPSNAGTNLWSVRFLETGSSLPHTPPTPTRFSFVASESAEHDVEIELVEEKTGTPIEGARLRFGPYHVGTDEFGRARLRLPNGEFKVSVYKKNHKASQQTVAVTGDLDLKLRAELVPEKDPYEHYWKQD